MEAEIKRINQLYERASRLAVKAIKDEARKILKADEGLDEFIMAMGSCFFTFKEGGKYDIFSYTDEQIERMEEAGHDWYGADNGILSDGFQPEFMEAVEDLNDMFKVLGYPVRFSADSEESHEW